MLLSPSVSTNYSDYWLQMFSFTFILLISIQSIFWCFYIWVTRRKTNSLFPQNLFYVLNEEIFWMEIESTFSLFFCKPFSRCFRQYVLLISTDILQAYMNIWLCIHNLKICFIRGLDSWLNNKQSFLENKSPKNHSNYLYYTTLLLVKILLAIMGLCACSGQNIN